MKQQTLSRDLIIEGIGLHSGVDVKMTIKPAPVNVGIVFKRIDLSDRPEIAALYSNVKDTRNSTLIGNDTGAVVSTIEHIMSALYIVGIDNAMIEIDNQEIPIMDGSAKIFYEKLKGVPLQAQAADRKFLKIKKDVFFSDDKGNSVLLKPTSSNDLIIDFEIEFPSKIVGYQRFEGRIDENIFASDIAQCRTFCEKYQIDYLKSVGLIKGGTLENAVVLDGETILNEEGFRCDNECVNHKVLDAIGDMYSSGFHIIGELKASRTGHFHSNELLKKLFADKDNYEILG